MNLVPPGVVGVLDKRSGHANVGADRRDGRVVAEGAACGPRVWLRHCVMTNDLEDEIAILCGLVPVV